MTMSVIRRFQAPVIAVLVFFLATPAVAACCGWTPEPMPCCEKSENPGLAAECCLSQADAPQRPSPTSTAKVSRLDAGLCVSSAALAPIAMARAAFDLAFDLHNGPPGTERLYLRLSVIRR
jgi:hypothetical protein